jgi:hypothetical protein
LELVGIISPRERIRCTRNVLREIDGEYFLQQSSMVIFLSEALAPILSGSV